MNALSPRFLLQMRALPILLSVAFSMTLGNVCGATSDAGSSGETLLPLRAGVASPFSYGLYNLKSSAAAATNAPAGNRLVLVVRNVGAKWVNFPEVASGNFSLMDSRGRMLKIELRDPPQPISYGEATLIQIFVPKTADESKPWTLRFKSSAGAKVPFDVSISGIKP